MAVVVLCLPTVPGARAAVRGSTARTLVPGLLTLGCLLVAAPATAQVNYAVSGSTAYVTGSPNASGDIVIASTYNGYPVTYIGDDAFWQCTSLTSVIIGNSVTSIGRDAFAGCTSLTNVTISNSVTSIGYAAFAGCGSLTSVTIPNSVSRIGYEAFMNCTQLTNFTFLGNAPVLVPYPTNSNGRWFISVGAGAKVYYYCGTTGWGATYGGSPALPTVMLCTPQVAPGSAGVKPGGFGFTVTRLTNQTIVVEASTNLVNWPPIWTNPPPGTSTNFVDPEWLNHSNRFYRARSD